MTKKLENLDQFTGTERWYRHALVRDVLYSDGAKYVAEEAGAYWLLDTIALCQRYDAAVKAETFQLWKLIVRADRTATLRCEDGNGGTVYTQAIAFTDFPPEGVSLYFCNSTIHLPSEY